jgi:tetratricopeptide (TPR) repeat protein
MAFMLQKFKLTAIYMAISLLCFSVHAQEIDIFDVEANDVDNALEDIEIPEIPDFSDFADDDLEGFTDDLLGEASPPPAEIETPAAAEPVPVEEEDIFIDGTPEAQAAPEAPKTPQQLEKEQYKQLKRSLSSFLKSFTGWQPPIMEDEEAKEEPEADTETETPEVESAQQEDDFGDFLDETQDEKSVAVAETATETPSAELVEEEIEPAKEEVVEDNNERLFAGSCIELPEKVAGCVQFECTMPKIYGSNEMVDVKVVPDESGKCLIERKMANAVISSCKFDASSRSRLSTSFAQYFKMGGNLPFDLKSDFATECAPEKPQPPQFVEAPAAKGRPAEEAEKVAGLVPLPVLRPQISAADKAYFEMLDKKRQALPANKQLSNKTLQAIEGVAPGLADKKQVTRAVREPEHIQVERGKNQTPGKEENGVLKSTSGINMSMRSDKKEQSNVNIKKKMDEAYRALMAGQISASINIYKQIIDKHHNNKDALFGLATAYHRNSQFEQARSIYTEILEDEPNNKEVLNNFLVLVAEEAPESAILELQKLERINSDFSPIPAQIGMIYLKIGDADKAERYLRRAALLSPDNITYKYNLAITSDRLGKQRQAYRLYQQIVEASESGAIIPGSINSVTDRMNFLKDKVR